MNCAFASLSSESTLDHMFNGGNTARELDVLISATLPMLLSAIDPVAEDAMFGLNAAQVAGERLQTDAGAVKGDDGNPTIPVLASSSTAIDQVLTGTIERVTSPSGPLSDAFAGERGVVARVGALPGTTIGTVGPVTAQTSYQEAITRPNQLLSTYWRIGDISYTQSGVTVAPRLVAQRASVYASPEFEGGAPIASDDVGVRKVTGFPLLPNQRNYLGMNVIGQFDPAKVTAASGLSGLTTETYANAPLPGADPASVAALRGGTLPATSNVAGYNAQPPALLTTFASAANLLDGTRYQNADPSAPISVIRVRAAGVTGADPVSRERMNQLALAISGRTGLAVDIVASASGVPQTVALLAGDHGRPALALHEDWAKKGVAYQVIDAVDRKSLALFLLILGVCAAVVGNAASASVRTRRTELGVLACVGWDSKRLFGTVQLELIVIGALAGLLGGTVALGVASALSLSTQTERAVLAIPAAILLCALAGVGPALRASRAAPMEAVRPQVSVPNRPVPLRTVTGFAIQLLRCVPGRTLVGATSLAIGVAAATFMVAVQQVFRGVVVGSMLGDAVTVQVRTPDILALAAIAALATAGVADVLYLTAREQAGDLAILQASGWASRTLSRVVLIQGVVVGTIGGILGAGVGCVAVAAFAGAFPWTMIPVALACALGGLLLATLAALVPALLIRRIPMTLLMAQDE